MFHELLAVDPSFARTLMPLSFLPGRAYTFLPFCDPHTKHSNGFDNLMFAAKVHDPHWQAQTEVVSCSALSQFRMRDPL